MFDAVELGQKLSKQEYEAALPELRTRLLKAQAQLEGAGFPVIVLINGADAAGKSETTNVLHEWLDARYLVSEAYAEPTEEERAHPEFWRFWLWLPPAGRIAIFQGNWYTRPILARASREIGSARYAHELEHIRKFEQTLADGGALFIKLWFHISKREQKKRLERLEGNPETRFRVTKEDWQHNAMHRRILRVCEEAVRETSTGAAAWKVIEAADDRHRNLSAGQEIVERLEERLKKPSSRPAPEPEPPRPDPNTVLDRVDLTKQVSKEEYDKRAPALQAKTNRLARKFLRQGQSAIFVFEGVDAAGKGGAIRRIVRALDARQYRVIPVAAPDEEERAHHYLWRFYRHLPRRGKVTIYDRSWYGRVLVERVEGFATREEWSRAYKEINEFEQELSNDGILIVKFWLHISADEQLRRFQAREAEPWKQHKITPEDYRNRAKKNEYEAAAAEMLERCSTAYAPFVLVPAEDKRHARLTVLETICERLAS
ncbi:MAG TPA: polyphosphate:AMP phosphotransferase [Polyangiaceae bacterium]|nr:polyphosphate:AMP phosphotransferase [Polyangiaceae bacterium]